jgi:hypothetical protein
MKRRARAWTNEESDRNWLAQWSVGDNTVEEVASLLLLFLCRLPCCDRGVFFRNLQSCFWKCSNICNFSLLDVVSFICYMIFIGCNFNRFVFLIAARILFFAPITFYSSLQCFFEYSTFNN